MYINDAAQYKQWFAI